ncbi:MAG TPA: ubiquinone/menaquinone biosynthesis methyltransferase, partial [Caldimonas sp.]
MSDTHFGFSSVDETAKAERVRGVFDSVAPKYDVMNDLMSFGLHRAWKAYTVAVANARPGDKVLDLAGGTGDLARAFAKPVGANGLVVHTDINEAMLRQGRDRLLDEGIVLPTALCDAEALPFANGAFDLVSVAFGLRNMTHKDKALAEMARVLKPGGRLLVLEFS